MKNELRECNERLTVLWNQADTLYIRWAEQCGIRYAELLVLYGLDAMGEATQTQMYEQFGLSKQTVNAVIRAWKQSGDILVRPGEKDRRERLLSLSETGKQKAARVLGPLHAAEDYAVSALGVERVEQMMATMACMKLLMEERMKLHRELA